MKNHNTEYNPVKPFSIYTLKGFVKIILFFGLLFEIQVQVAAQNTPAKAGQSGTEWFNIVHADSLYSLTNISVLLQGNVIIRQENTMFYCDRAIQNTVTNMIEAFGNVRVVEGDTISVTGDSLTYFGHTRYAVISGKKTTLKDKERTLTSRKLEYDMMNGIASYRQPGKTIDKENTLTSKEGLYNTRTKEYTYYRDVVLVNKRYTLNTDTLVYDPNTHWANFRGNTRLKNKDGVLVGTKGRYNTESGQSIFSKRTQIDNESYTLTGDSLSYNEPKKDGYAKGNVYVFVKKDKTILTGNEGFYNNASGVAKVFGKGLVKTLMSGDTLYIRGDTLMSIENKADSTRKLFANKNVHLFKSDFQGKCDSLIYDSADSLINFYKKPILWSQNYQLEADSITAFLIKNRLHRMYLRSKAFIISQDSVTTQFNQIKGRVINAMFGDSSQVREVLVDGNGESIYYAADDNQKMIGLNRVTCARIRMNFKQGQISRIAFIGQPDGKLIPPHEIKPANRELDGFSWKIKEKPDLKTTTWQNATK